MQPMTLTILVVSVFNANVCHFYESVWRLLLKDCIFHLNAAIVASTITTVAF